MGHLRSSQQLRGAAPSSGADPPSLRGRPFFFLLEPGAGLDVMATTVHTVNRVILAQDSVDKLLKLCKMYYFRL